MMRILNIMIFVCSLFWLACQKTVEVNEVVLIHASSPKLLADGLSMDTVYADLPINTLAANLPLLFQATSGTFINGFDTMTIVANRTDLTPGKITAIAFFKASLRPGLDTILVSTYTIPQYVNYLQLTLDTVFADSVLVVPATYTTPDSFGVALPVTGKLFNPLNGMVSSGMQVQFSDTTDSGQPAGGTFQPQLMTVDSSAFSTLYFPPQLPPGSTTGIYVTIKAAVIVPAGSSGASGSARIYISP